MKRTAIHIVLTLCLACTACGSSKPPHTQFHRPKYETSTKARETRGKPSVRQTWYSKFWFWQQRDRRPNTNDR